MTSQSNEPAAPQTEVATVKGTNQTAHIGPYVDRDFTLRNVDGDVAELDVPPPSGSTTLGGIRPVYANDQLHDIQNTAAATENVDVTPPVHAPNKWEMQTRAGRRYKRDPYANEGLDSYHRNQS